MSVLPYEYDGSIMLQSPALINWHYTYKCLLNCVHCYSRISLNERELSCDEKNLVAENIIKNQVFFVNFGGGECLLDPFLPQIICKLSAVGVCTSLSTSGWMFSEDSWPELKKCGLDRITLSLDSPIQEMHDSQRGVKGIFQSALRCMDICINIGLPVFLSTVLTRDNFNYLEQLFELALEHHCSGIDMKRLRLSGNATYLQSKSLTHEQEYILFSNIKQWKLKYNPLTLNLSYKIRGKHGIDNGCLCGKKLLTIRSNGDISACSFTPKILGNALIDDIGELWRNNLILQTLRQGEICLADNVIKE